MRGHVVAKLAFSRMRGAKFRCVWCGEVLYSCKGGRGRWQDRTCTWFAFSPLSSTRMHGLSPGSKPGSNSTLCTTTDLEVSVEKSCSGGRDEFGEVSEVSSSFRLPLLGNALKRDSGSRSRK